MKTNDHIIIIILLECMYGRRRQGYEPEGQLSLLNNEVPYVEFVLVMGGANIFSSVKKDLELYATSELKSNCI